MPAIEEQRATCNLPSVKNCYFSHAGDISTEDLRSSSISNVIKTGNNGFFNSLLFGACYDSKRHKASDCCARSNHAKDMQIAGMSIRSLPEL